MAEMLCSQHDDYALHLVVTDVMIKPIIWLGRYAQHYQTTITRFTPLMIL